MLIICCSIQYHSAFSKSSPLVKQRTVCTCIHICTTILQLITQLDFYTPAHLTRGLRLDREDYKSFLSQVVFFGLIMKLDTKALRYLTAEDWRVLTAVRFFPELLSMKSKTNGRR